MAVRLPKLKIGRFLRKSVAPLVPGGKEAAENVNDVIRRVKGQSPSPGEIVPATTQAIRDVNAQERMKNYVTLALIGVAVFFLLLRRR